MEGAYDYGAQTSVQYPFGFGLSYTTFTYSNMSVDKTDFTSDDIVKVSVDVTNSGEVEGKESVLLFSSDLVASLSPDVRRLRGFEKISLKPGETKTVTFSNFIFILFLELLFSLFFAFELLQLSNVNANRPDKSK
jgi:beta-glucosidase